MILELKKTSGLELNLDTEKAKLILASGIHFSEPAVRTIDEMREVLMDKKLSSPKDLYYMYRDVHLETDSALLEKNKLRYDVTVIKPDPLGKELMKTAGHYHPGSFGELYEVVAGRGFCMLQRPDVSDHTIIKEVIVVEAKAGQKIVIPPGFGHILINPGPDNLVTSNWVSSVFKSEYDLYKKAQGAAYFMVKAALGTEFIANSYFKRNAEIKFVKPSAKLEKFGLAEGEPIYPLVRKNAAKLDFLNRPLDFDYADCFITADPKK